MTPRPLDEQTDNERLAHAYVAAAGGSIWAALVLAVGDGLAAQRDADERSASLHRLVSCGYVRSILHASNADGVAR